MYRELAPRRKRDRESIMNCEDCGGTGDSYRPDGGPCDRCNGSGYTKTKMKYQEMKKFHPSHCGFALRGHCPDLDCPRTTRQDHAPDVLRLPQRVETDSFLSGPPRPGDAPGPNIETFIRREKAHPGLGLVWWEWVPYNA